MCVLKRDFDREPHLISSIPMNSLDTIKEWLTSIQIKFYETKVNLVWKTILQSIKDDPDTFYSEGGWEFLNLDDDEDGDDDDEDEEDQFDPELEGGGDVRSPNVSPFPAA
jgi:nucleosome binding factor SPN SPT16 subunit